MRFLKRNITVNLLLTALAALYFFPFVNRGLIFFDEGYMIHFAQRIVQGQVPYYDFFIQYTPGFFYLLALSFKLFGTTVLVGRIVTMIIALMSILITLVLLDELQIHSLKLKMSSATIMATLGFPLLNVPIDIWPCILLTIIIMIFFLKWSTIPGLKYTITLGILLSLTLFMKQNIGFGFLLLVNMLILFSQKKKFAEKIKSIVIIDCLFVILSIPWIYYFFIRSGDLSEFLRFSHDFVTNYPFSYPSLFFIVQPLGVFKLLPYYLPVIFFFILCYSYFFKKERSMYLFLSTFPLVGFGLTIIPLTDLIHIYPFLGLLFTMFLVFVQKTNVRFNAIYIVLIGITALLGVYLTFFKGQYRYELPYKVDTAILSLPPAKGLLIYPSYAQDLTVMNTYLDTHTKKSDYIFVYPFSPMLYFLLDRQNLIRYANLLPGNLTTEEELQTVKTLKDKKVEFVIIAGNYQFNTPVSQWIIHNTIPVKLKIKEVGQIRKVVNNE